MRLFIRAPYNGMPMYRTRLAAVVLWAFSQFLLSLPTSAQSLDALLGDVSRNVKEFQETLPDFVCNERITSTESADGRVIKERVVESVFTGVQRSNVENRFRFAFTESREVLAIDGKAAPKGTAFPKLPYRFAVGFSSLLITTFAPENLRYHNYSIADTYKSATGTAVLVQFATKDDQQALRTMIQGTRLFAKDVGAVWIDLASSKVLRLQRQALNLPPGFSRSMTTADYGPVTIGEQQFWMPIKIKAEVTERNSRATVTYIAEYSDCRKFTAEIKLLP